MKGIQEFSFDFKPHLSNNASEYEDFYDIFKYHEENNFLTYRILLIIVVIYTDYLVAFTSYIIINVSCKIIL